MNMLVFSVFLAALLAVSQASSTIESPMSTSSMASNWELSIPSTMLSAFESSSTLMSAEEELLLAAASDLTVAEELMDYFYPSSISDADDSSDVEYLAYLEAKFPKLAKALQAVANYFKKYPQYAKFEEEFMEAAEQDPSILSQYSTFVKHQQQLYQQMAKHQA